MWTLTVFFIICVTGCGSPKQSLFDTQHERTASSVLQGDTYSRGGVHNKALEYYTEALENRACTVNVYQRLAETFNALDDPEKAWYYARYSLKYYIRDINSYLLSGQLKLDQDPSLAEKYFKRALDLSPPKLKPVVQKRIEVLKKKADETFTGPDPEAIAMSIAAKAETEHAEAAFNKSYEASGEIRYKAVLRAGVLLAEKGYMEKAEELYRLAWRDSGKNAFLILSGNLFLRQDNPARAAVYYRKYIELEPEQGTGYFNMGVIYLRNGHDSRASAMFSRAGESFAGKAEQLKKDHAAGKEIFPIEAVE